MQKEPYLIASDESLTNIVAVIGKDYNEFVRNITKLFPCKGAALVQKLVNGKQDQLYRTSTVYKKRCRIRKARLVYSPSKELKKLQRLLDTFIRGQYADHASSHGFVTGRSPRTAAEAVKAVENLNEKELTNLDISGAFPAITGRVIRKLLRHETKDSLNNWQINILSKIATTSNDRLATGAPSSPAIFNWRLTSADQELEKITTPRNWKAVRYADDISIVHYRTQKNEVVKTVINLLKNYGLRVERKKLKTFRKDTKIITGIVIRHGRLGAPRKTRRIHRAIAHQMSQHYPAIESKNRYEATELYRQIWATPTTEARTKGSQEAQLCGFAAYEIGIVRRTQETTMLNL
jgi:hypothetical protein